MELAFVEQAVCRQDLLLLTGPQSIQATHHLYQWRFCQVRQPGLALLSYVWGFVILQP